MHRPLAFKNSSARILSMHIVITKLSSTSYLAFKALVVGSWSL